MVSSGTFDCRSYDLQTYASSILKKRVERFSTVYACVFVTAAEAAGGDGASGGSRDGMGASASTSTSPVDMLLTASSTGELRLFRLSDMVQRWTAGRQSTDACCSWAAHVGPVFCLAKAQAGNDVMLFSGGDDGYVRGWRLSDVLRAHSKREQQIAGQGQQQHGGLEETVCEVQPCLAVRLPRAESPLGAISLPPAVQALAVAGGEAGGAGATTLFVGCSDGGVHSLDVASGAVSQPQRTPSGAGAGAGGCHAAAVLAMDFSAAASCLATGSEDGTVRLWDARAGGASCCARTLDTGAAGGREVPGSGAEALRCLRNPHTSCLRFEPSGSWLMCGHGGGARNGGGGGSGGGGSLSMWDLGMGQRARQVSTGFVPQAMVVLPAEVLVVGSEAALSRFSVSLAQAGPVRQPLASASAFGLDVHPGSGSVAVGGCGASVELLSKYGKKTGGSFFTSEED